MITLLLVDDQPAARAGIRMRLSLESDIEIVGEAADGRTALDLAHQLQAAVIVMDFEMPGMNGVQAAAAMRAQGLTCAIIMISLYDDPDIRRQALAAGANAFVPKQSDPQRLIAAIRAATRP